MAPKKPPKQPKGDENSWRKWIEAAVLNDDKWSLKAVIVDAAGNDQDRIYLGKFEAMALEERRYVIRNICKTETIFMVNQLGAEKKVKDDNLRVFEEGQAYIKEKQDIPAEIMALIIKHLLIKMKEDYCVVQRQKLEVQEGLRQESAIMLDKAEVRGTVGAKPREAPTPPSTAKGKGKKSELDPGLAPVPEAGKKYNTVLRERGEEWRDKVYVDDFPTDGPNLYVAITGFLDPLLPYALVKIGVPISAVVQIRIDPTIVKVPSTLFRGTKRGQSQTEILAEQATKFWEDLQELRVRQETADLFKSTAFIIFYPPYWNSEELSGNPDKIYDEMSYLLYDVQDMTRQHLHFLDNMDIMHIPEDTEDIHLLNNYHRRIDDLPLECITMYSVLDALLEATCSIVDRDPGAGSRSSLSTAVTLNQNTPTSAQHHGTSKQDSKLGKADKLVKEVFTHLCQTEEKQKSFRVTYGDEYEEHKDPVIMNYGDFAKYNNFHLGNINLDNIVMSTLLGMPINNLWMYQDRPELEFEAKLNFHVNVLLSCFDREDVETAELNRLLHILACRKLYNNRSSLKKQHLGPTTIYELKKDFLKRSVIAQPLAKCPSLTIKGSSSFPSMTKSENVSIASEPEVDPEVSRIKFLFDCPDISELVSAAEIAKNHPINHIIDDFEYFEDFTNGDALQVMLDAFNKFNCVDYKYCEVTDCIVLMFFNSHDKDGIAREEWRNFLPTPVCLQDFFDYVLEENYAWIQNEERIYDENMVLKEQSQIQDLFDPFAAKSCIEDKDVETDLLMEGSLKHHALQAVQDSPASAESVFTDKNINKSPVSIDTDSKTSRKPPSSIPKKIKHSFLSMRSDSYSEQLEKKAFSGFDISDRRVETIGKDSTFFSQDGTKVSSEYTLTIPMNLEYIVLNVSPGSGGIDFWIHKALGERCSNEAAEVSESFRVTTKDQVMINIKKRMYELIIPNPETPPPNPTIAFKQKFNTKSPQNFPETPKAKGNQRGASKAPNPPHEPDPAPIIEKISYHSLYVTWPNGQITESVHVDNSAEISHMKQFFVTENPNKREEMRCISLFGEVIIFKTSGDIEVLRPGGTYILINKCSKNINYPESLIPSESDIDKKLKDKSNKYKDNTGKSRSPVPPEDPAILYGYALDVEEFEIIETSGLRQKWTKDTYVDIEKLLIRTATDYCLGEIFSRRMDGTHCLLNKDGLQIFTFPDKTRIITQFVIEEEEIFPEWTDLEKEYFEIFSETEMSSTKMSMSQKSNVTYNSNSSAVSGTSSMSKKLEEEEDIKERPRSDGYVSVQIIYTVENLYFATVTVNKQKGTISVDSPNNASVTIDSNNHYDILLDSATCAQFDGNNLHISYEACHKCKSFTECDINMTNTRESNSLPDLKSYYWLKMRDSFCKKIVINEEGNIIILDEPCSQETLYAEHGQTEEARVETEEKCNKQEPEESTVFEDITKSEPKFGTSSVTSHGKCREAYNAKAIRFFVLRRDLTCSEIVHRAIVEQYKRACRWQPWCSINQYDTFGDHRVLWSLLTPVHLTETEKWLMDSKLADKPKYLTFKDLKPDTGKGFYHWMRPYERFEPKPMKPENALPPRLPRAFILRTLELQWGESERDELKGAKELLSAILKYRQVMAQDCESLLHVPVIDPRAEDERLADQLVQEIGHKIYEELKARLAEDVQSRARADITTKPAPVPEEPYLEGEQEEGEPAPEEPPSQSLLEQLEEAEPISPNLQRYWRRRAEELKEEQFYQYLLRESSVPPYFLGSNYGAIWWELNKAAGDAVTGHERRTMKCACPEEETSSSPNVDVDQPLLM